MNESVSIFNDDRDNLQDQLKKYKSSIRSTRLFICMMAGLLILLQAGKFSNAFAGVGYTSFADLFLLVLLPAFICVLSFYKPLLAFSLVTMLSVAYNLVFFYSIITSPGIDEPGWLFIAGGITIQAAFDYVLITGTIHAWKHQKLNKRQYNNGDI